MAAFIVRNLTGQDIVLPSPVGYILKANSGLVNLTEEANISPSDIRAIASTLNKLEQTGKISIDDVANTLSAIESASDASGDIHPLIIKDAMAEEKTIQIPLWNGVSGVVGTPKTLKLCVTDGGGSPNILMNREVTMTVTSSSATCKLNGTNSTTAQVTIKNGIGEFTVLNTAAGAVDLAITGSAPANVVTGETLTIQTPYTITFA